MTFSTDDFRNLSFTRKQQIIMNITYDQIEIARFETKTNTVRVSFGSRKRVFLYLKTTHPECII